MNSTQKSEQSLSKALGIWALAASIFNCTVGGGIFRLPAAVHSMIGAASPWVYVVCAVVIGLIVLCFAEAGSRVSLTGGPYAYVETVFGGYVGFMAGVLVWLMGTLAIASVASALAGNIGALIPVLSQPIARGLMLAVIFFALSWVNIRGVQHGTKVVQVASIAKLVPLMILIGVGAFFIEPANLHVAQAPEASTIARTAMVLIFAFTGVESALVPSGEVKDPARTVPRALAIAMIGVTVLYLSVQIVAQGVLGADLGVNKAAPLAAAAGKVMGSGGMMLLLIGAIVSMFGYVSGMTLAIPRAFYAFARDGVLPKKIASVHAEYHTPHVAIAIQSAIVCFLAISSSFEDLAVISNLSALLLYFLCAIAAWELRRRDVRTASGSKPFKLPGGPLVPVATCGVILWLLSSITHDEWVKVGAVLVVASMLFMISKRGQKKTETIEVPGAVGEPVT